MKKLILTLLVLGVSCSVAFGQGAIRFSNLGSFSGQTVNAKVFAVDGTTALAGTGFSIGLWFGADAGSLEPYTGVNSVLAFNTGAFAGYTAASPNIQLPGFATGQTVTIQLRAWDNAGGAITSFDAAAIKGVSNTFTSLPLGDALNPATIPALIGLQTFQLVPEPTTYALLAIGLAALAFRRRK